MTTTITHLKLEDPNVLHSEWKLKTGAFSHTMQQVRVLVKENGDLVIQTVEQSILRFLYDTARKIIKINEDNVQLIGTVEEHVTTPWNLSEEKDEIQSILNSRTIHEIPAEIHHAVVGHTATEKTATKFTETFSPAAAPTFISVRDHVNSHLTENPLINRSMQAMADELDHTAEKKFSAQVDHEIHHAMKRSGKELSHEEKTRIEAKVCKKFEDSLAFFTTVDVRKGPETPLLRMAAPFAALTSSPDPAFWEGIDQFAAHAVKLAFEQHRENPEQYVSHGFDHSINVTNYTRDVLEMNPQIVSSMAKKYRITEGEANFLLENVALLHDTGYPCIGCKTKAAHGISGADLVIPMRPMLAKLITSPDVDMEILFNDFRNAILFHSADKIEAEFGAKIHTTTGVFLADPKNIVTVLSNFYDPKKNPGKVPRYTLEIYVQNPEEKAAIEKAIAESREEFERSYGGSIEMPKVTIHGSMFKGRYADLDFTRDRLLGLEYSVTDLLENPLNMIRLVDNMDMRQTRLTPTQNEAAFREVYVRLGDCLGLSQLAMELENFERTVDKKRAGIPQNNEVLQKELATEIAKGTQEILARHIAAKVPGEDPLEVQVKEYLRASPLTEISTVKQARDLLNQALLDVIFKQDQWKLPPSLQDEIRMIGMLQSSYDFRHFGGTEAIVAVELKSIPSLEITEGAGQIPCVVVTVNREHFDKLNQVKVNEEGLMIGVGEYQIWRASDAYKSLSLGNTNIQLRVFDEAGAPVACIINET